MQNLIVAKHSSNILEEVLTETMPSLADNTRISEQETTPGHSLSKASLIVSMYLKFLIPKLLSVSFSESVLLVESSSSDASHDCKSCCSERERGRRERD